MDKQTWARTLIAGSIAGAGLVVGGVSLASADAPAHGPSFHRGPAGPLGADLAEELGVSEAKLADALEAVHDDLKPSEPADRAQRTPPTESQVAEHRAAFAAALADELGLSEATVSAALDNVRAEAQADHRDVLSARLSDAVDAGDLTEADKASVLKAFDADVLGRPFGGGGRH